MIPVLASFASLALAFAFAFPLALITLLSTMSVGKTNLALMHKLRISLAGQSVA